MAGFGPARGGSSPPLAANYEMVSQNNLFENGERVKLVTNIYGDCENNPVWGGSCGFVQGTVLGTKKYGKHPVLLETYIKWDNGGMGHYTPGCLLRVDENKGRSCRIAIKVEECDT